VSSVRRIIVGASGSPGSLPALRYARQLARDLAATLVPVLCWLPPDGDLADRRTPCPELRRIWAQDARQRLQGALNLAWGEVPADLLVRPVIRRGQPGQVLVDAVYPGDLLVVGAGRRGALARIVHGRVSRYCLAHARCPVLIVPPLPLAEETHRRALAQTFRRRTLTVDQISPDKRGNRSADAHLQAS
jgi:nucleotide-binding universal stress UspA family protein